MAILPELSENRAQLFRGFLRMLYKREMAARERRQDASTVPDQNHWLAVMGELAETLQFAGGAQSDAGAQTVLSRADWPGSLNKVLLDFSRDASVLQLTGDDLRFTHQLLQEYLASRVLLISSQADHTSATRYWPEKSWWQRSGWEVVAEIAAESLDKQTVEPFIAWLARANPALAAEVWEAQNQPELGDATRQAIHDQWFTRMTDAERVPQSRARAAIGTALGRFGLDDRPGIGLDGAMTNSRSISTAFTSAATPSPMLSTRPSSMPVAMRRNAGGRIWQSRNRKSPPGTSPTGPGLTWTGTKQWPSAVGWPRS
jgi:hypothetical protein